MSEPKYPYVADPPKVRKPRSELARKKNQVYEVGLHLGLTHLWDEKQSAGAAYWESLCGTASVTEQPTGLNQSHCRLCMIVRNEREWK